MTQNEDNSWLNSVFAQTGKRAKNSREIDQFASQRINLKITNVLSKVEKDLSKGSGEKSLKRLRLASEVPSKTNIYSRVNQNMPHRVVKNQAYREIIENFILDWFQSNLGLNSPKIEILKKSAQKRAVFFQSS